MIESQRGSLIIATCDECGEQEQGDYISFKEFIQILKENNWSIKNFKGEWLHQCPNCKGDL